VTCERQIPSKGQKKSLVFLYSTAAAASASPHAGRPPLSTRQSPPDTVVEEAIPVPPPYATSVQLPLLELEDCSESTPSLL
ncbi:unnamed protein product, partial [Linum tenue]